MFIGSLRELCEYLSKSSEVLLKNSQHLDNVLETLDIQQHSLGILAVLCAKFSVPAVTAQDNRFTQAQEFILGCNGEQIRYAPDTCIFRFWYYNKIYIDLIIFSCRVMPFSDKIFSRTKTTYERYSVVAKSNIQIEVV